MYTPHPPSIMRTTLTVDDDVAALMERERQRTGETMRQVINRLLRQGLQRGRARPTTVVLPTLPGRPRTDITDASAVLAEPTMTMSRPKACIEPAAGHEPPRVRRMPAMDEHEVAAT